MKTAHYIHMNSDWPNFIFTAPCTDDIYHALGILEGMLHVAPPKIKEAFNAHSIEDETLSSYEIEGEIMQRSSIRASIDKIMRLALSDSKNGNSTIKSDSAVTVLLDARSGGRLSQKRLLQWHGTMFSHEGPSLYDVKAGAYRASIEPMKIVSGPLEKERIHYIAPSSATLASQMAHYFLWLHENEENTIIKAGIAHLYFLLIHPFEDGNGRIARAISDNIFSEFALPLFSISTEILKDRKAYYHTLDIISCSPTMDITLWLEWWCDLVLKAVQSSLQNASGIVMRARFWSASKNFSLNQRQNKVLDKMCSTLPLEFEGGMSSKKYRSITKASTATSTRDLQELVKCGILISKGSARAVKYHLNRELFTS